MLVLTRKSGEKLRIGNDIVITILENQTGQVKIGIHAPRTIPIYREEIYERIQTENRSAVMTEAFNPELLKQLGVHTK